MHKAGSLPSGRVVLSRPLERYDGPLRFPPRPARRRTGLLRRRWPLSPTITADLPHWDRSTSTPGHPGYPERPDGTLSLSDPTGGDLPRLATGSASSLDPRGYLEVRLRCGLRLVSTELTTPGYPNAAPIHYKGVRATPLVGLKPASKSACYGVRRVCLTTTLAGGTGGKQLPDNGLNPTPTHALQLGARDKVNGPAVRVGLG